MKVVREVIARTDPGSDVDIDDLDEESLGTQVWFAEKDRAGRTTLKALVDFDPRSTDNIELGYLRGRYGAIPAHNWHEFEELADHPGFRVDVPLFDPEQHATTASR